MNDQQPSTDFDASAPVNIWRRRFANLLVASYGMGMWLLFSNAMVIFLFALAGQHKIAALIAGAMSAAGFAGTILVAKFAPQCFAVSDGQVGRKTVYSGFLRRFRSLVGNGDMIQSFARRIDPSWRNPYSWQTPQKTANFIFTAEVIHWAALIASIAPIAVGFWYNYLVFSYIFLVVNLVYNILPIPLIRETRRRLSRISKKVSRVRDVVGDREIGAAT